MTPPEALRRIEECKKSEHTELDLNSLKLTEIPPEVAELIWLQSLYLFGNQISEIKRLEKLTNLTVLNLSSNQISEIKGLEKLTNLTILSLYGNQISEIKRLEKLANLKELYLHSNQISEIKGLEKLTNLTVLSLHRNQIREIKGLEKLANLTELFLSLNKIIKIEGLSLKQLENMKVLDLNDNPIFGVSLSNFADLPGIIGYLKSKETDQLVQNRRLKVNILGAGRVGKTQLLNFFKNRSFIPDDSVTHGTNTLDYSIPTSQYRAKIWDFGGQSYHHGFHYLFLRPSDFYLVLWRNCRLSKPDYGYWLGTARAFAPDPAPLLLAQNCWNEKSDKYRQDFPDDLLPDETGYPDSARLRTYKLGLHDVFAIDVQQLANPNPTFRETYFLNELHRRMTLHADSFEKISEKWVNVAETLEKKPLKSIYLKKDGFRKKYAPDFDDTAFAGLLNYLEFSGNILSFKNSPLLSQYVFANPPRLSKWIFEDILDQTQTGKISRKTLEKRPGLGKEKTDLFFALMEEFRLIFRQPHWDETDDKTDQYYIIPQFLPEYKHSFKQVLLELLPFTFSLQFPDFIHEGRIFQFIAAYGQYARDNTAFWKYGLLFGYEINRQNKTKTPEQKEQDTLQVLVYYLSENRQLMVHIEDGKGRSEVAREIFDYFVFDLNPITENRTGKVTRATKTGERPDLEALPELTARRNREAKDVKTAVSLSTSRPYFFDVAETMRNLESKNPFGTCVETQKRIPLDFMAINLLSREDRRKLRVFVSYSHKDENYRNELDAHLTMLKRSGRIEVWHDREIRAGDDWDNKIKRQLELADIALLLISADFLNSNYIWEQELGLLRKRLDQQDGVIVIPVFTRPCDTTDLDLKRFQGGHRDLQGMLPWISTSANKDQMYAEIAGEIRKTIDAIR